MRKPITECLQSILIPGESVECTAIQRGVFALIDRRRLIAATSNRFIGLDRPVLAGFDLQSIRWQDLKDVRISVGILAPSCQSPRSDTQTSLPNYCVPSSTNTQVFANPKPQRSTESVKLRNKLGARDAV
jgi:hypothetical protein